MATTPRTQPRPLRARLAKSSKYAQILVTPSVVPPRSCPDGSFYLESPCSQLTLKRRPSLGIPSIALQNLWGCQSNLTVGPADILGGAIPQGITVPQIKDGLSYLRHWMLVVDILHTTRDLRPPYYVSILGTKVGILWQFTTLSTIYSYTIPTLQPLLSSQVLNASLDSHHPNKTLYAIGCSTTLPLQHRKPGEPTSVSHREILWLHTQKVIPIELTLSTKKFTPASSKWGWRPPTSASKG